MNGPRICEVAYICNCKCPNLMIPDQTRPDVSVLLFTMSGSRAEKGHRHNACALRSVVADRPRRSGDPQFRTDRQYLLLPPSHAGRKIQGKKIHMYGRVLYYNVLCIPGFSNDLDRKSVV